MKKRKKGESENENEKVFDSTDDNRFFNLCDINGNWL